jgi:hypothetical protein
VPEISQSINRQNALANRLPGITARNCWQNTACGHAPK